MWPVNQPFTSSFHPTHLHFLTQNLDLFPSQDPSKKNSRVQIIGSIFFPLQNFRWPLESSKSDHTGSQTCCGIQSPELVLKAKSMAQKPRSPNLKNHWSLYKKTYPCGCFGLRWFAVLTQCVEIHPTEGRFFSAQI